MTIQSLCNAIRSQLYFSQVSSWVDLLKKAFTDEDMSVKDQMPKQMFSPEIMQNPRLKKNLQTMQVDLDILFRIKVFDGATCFNDKPIVHNFPDTMVSDRTALRVCLKSLPRLEKIPTLNTEKANINGFSCDNRIKTLLGVPAPLGSPVAGTSCHLLHDRMTYPLCHETGKHRCKNEDEDYDVEENVEKQQTRTANTFTPTQETPAAQTSTPLTHRERQLLKYKKRLMKRDKQKKKVQDGDQTSVSSLNTSGSEEFDKFQETAINNTFAPLYAGNGTSSKAEKPGNNVNKKSSFKTLSVATQTEHTDVAKPSICNYCGESLQCWNCDKNQSKLKSQTTTSGPVNKADLLLQAIQRTADAHTGGPSGVVVARDNRKDNIFNKSKSHHRDGRANPSSVAISASDPCDKVNDNNNYLINNNNLTADDGDDACSAKQETYNDCRLCKRQKTRHNYTTSMSISSSSSGGSYRRTMSECLVGLNPGNEEDEADGAMGYSQLPVHNSDDSEFNYANNAVQVLVEDGHGYGDLKAYRRAFSEDVINQLPAETCCFESKEDDDCITFKCHHCNTEKAAVESQTPFKLTPNVKLLQGQVSSKWPVEKLLANQKIPKINLSHVFDSFQMQNDSGIVEDTSPSSDSVFTFTSSPSRSYPPTLMQVSPRFSRTTNSLLKRRSRHMSDRSSISEYSNFSDEDEEVLKVVVEPVNQLPAPKAPSSTLKISSLYKKFVTKTSAAFNKLPLLGSIEESLLRDRFEPKAIVSGFKLLLGASGSFCPTQLTIPAQTFFYEFKGMRHMSTPYVVSSYHRF